MATDLSPADAQPSPGAAPYVAVVLLAFTALLFAPSLRGGLSNDDFIWIEGAWRQTRSGWLAAALVPHPWWSRSFLRPLVQLTFFVNFLSAGLRPWVFHATNIALHLVNVWLLLRLALRRLPSRAAALAALLFALHPAQAWTVGWVSGRTQLLCATFLLLALHAHLRRRAWLAVAAFAAALLANEAAVVFPAIAWCADHWLAERRGDANPARIFHPALLIYAVPLAAYVVVRAMATQQLFYGVVGVDASAMRDAASASALWRGKLTLLGEYLFAPLPVHGFWRSVALLSALATAVLVMARRNPTVAFAAAWLALSLAPYTAWYQLQPWYLYLPSAALSLAAAAAFASVRRAQRRHTLAGLLAGVWLAAAGWQLSLGIRARDRTGQAHMKLLAALRAAEPSPPAGTRFCLSGLDAWRLGMGPGGSGAVFVFGLNEAARLEYGDPSLGAAFADQAGACAGGGTPAIHLSWQAQQERFAR